MTNRMAANAEVLATVFRERAPWCHCEPSLPFTALDNEPATIEALTIANGTGNSVELAVVDVSSLTNLHSLHIEERCFLYAKRAHPIPVMFRFRTALLSAGLDVLCIRWLYVHVHMKTPSSFFTYAYTADPSSFIALNQLFHSSVIAIHASLKQSMKGSHSFLSASRSSSPMDSECGAQDEPRMERARNPETRLSPPDRLPFPDDCRCTSLEPS